jgi:hypothetical protein
VIKLAGAACVFVYELKVMDEPTDVEVRFGVDGSVTLLSFTWQGSRLRVTSMGRQWVEGERRHFLVMVAGDQIFELSHHRGAGQWRIVHAPQQKLSA